MDTLKNIGGWYDEEDPVIAEARAAAEKAGTHLISDWRNSLPEEIQADPIIMKYTDVPNLAKALINAQKLVGADKIAIPGQDADDETWADVYNRLGRPEGPDKYAIHRPDELPDGFNYNEQLELDFRKEAHMAGLSNKQANKIWGMLQAKAIGAYKGIKGKHDERLEADDKQLRNDWGAAYDEKEKIGNKVIIAADAKLPGFKQWATENGLINEPMFKRFANLLGETANEEQLGPSEIRESMTPAEAKAKVNSIRLDPTNPKYAAYHNNRDPRHREVVEETIKLEMLTGGDE